MTQDKIGGLLGLARRAGRVSLGHDASVEAIQKKSAYLCLLASDASERLGQEMARAVQAYGEQAVLYKTEYTMVAFGMALGTKKTAVLTVNDAGFAKKIIEYIGRE